MVALAALAQIKEQVVVNSIPDRLVPKNHSSSGKHTYKNCNEGSVYVACRRHLPGRGVHTLKRMMHGVSAMVTHGNGDGRAIDGNGKERSSAGRQKKSRSGKEMKKGRIRLAMIY